VTTDYSRTRIPSLVACSLGALWCAGYFVATGNVICLAIAYYAAAIALQISGEGSHVQ